MISKVLNRSFAAHNYLCGLRTKTKFAVIIFVLHLAAAPTVAIAAIASVYGRTQSFELCQALAIVGAVTTALAGALGIYLAIVMLYNKT